MTATPAYKVIKDKRSGQWFFSVINADGLLNVGWWMAEEEAKKAAEAHQRRKE